MPHPYAKGRLLHEYGVLHARTGKSGQAQKRFHKALNIFRKLKAVKDAERTERELLALIPVAIIRHA